MTVSKKSISVILPNFNGKDLLEEFIPSIVDALNFSSIEFEFIVVDDQSTDTSVAFLEQQFPFITIVENEINKGFSYSCNRGIQIAKNDLVFFSKLGCKTIVKLFRKSVTLFRF